MQERKIELNGQGGENGQDLQNAEVATNSQGLNTTMLRTSVGYVVEIGDLAVLVNEAPVPQLNHEVGRWESEGGRPDSIGNR